MSPKPFRTIDEQLEILEKRGLIIPDKEIAKEFFQFNNYYRISGSSLTLRNHDKFYDNVYLSNLMDIYNFDHEFRILLLNYLEMIEVKIKSVYSYLFAQKYGPTKYKDSRVFTDSAKYLDLYTKINIKIEERKQSEAYLLHFVDELQEDIPIWALVDLMSFSDISKLYRISENTLQKNIADTMGFKTSNGNDILCKHLFSLTILRNFCAHESRLYNRLFVRKPSLSKKEIRLLRINPDNTRDNSHLYGFIIVMKHLLNKSEFLSLKTSIQELNNKYPFVNLKNYGFTDTWINDL